MKKTLITAALLASLNFTACQKQTDSTKVQEKGTSKMQAKAVAKTKEVGMDAASSCSLATDKQSCLKNFGKTKTSQEVTKQINKI